MYWRPWEARLTCLLTFRTGTLWLESSIMIRLRVLASLFYKGCSWLLKATHWEFKKGTMQKKTSPRGGIVPAKKTKCTISLSTKGQKRCSIWEKVMLPKREMWVCICWALLRTKYTICQSFQCVLCIQCTMLRPRGCWRSCTVPEMMYSMESQLWPVVYSMIFVEL